MHGFISGLSNLFHWSILYYVILYYIIYFCFCASSVLDDCCFVVQSEVRKVDFSSSILLSQGLLWLFEGFLCFYKSYEIIGSSSVKNTIGSLIGIVLNLQIALDSILIFTILILPIHEHGIYLHLFVSSLIFFINVLQFFVSLGKLIPKYFILFTAMVNGIVSLISPSVFSLLVYRNAQDFCVLSFYDNTNTLTWFSVYFIAP